MIAETPYPGRVMPGTRLVVRYHDAIPMLMPHTISDRSYHQASHYQALKRNVADGAWFACVSDATRKDLLSVFPEVADRAVTIHNMVSHHYYGEESSARLVPEIANIRRSQSIKAGGGRMWAAADADRPYLLMVSTIEPRKNHLALLSAWEQLRTELLPDLQLVLVGELGWDHKAIVKRLRPWLDRGGLHLLEDVPAPELRLLYRHAAATVCPSFGEGFDFSGVEAMRCGGVVAASDIPVHHDIFADAAEYFSPYSPGQLADALRRLLSNEAQPRRQVLVSRGAEVSGRYLPERVLPRWQDFLLQICRA
jgi:glycosyltransferase involved in cell wall biosynthesis